MFHTPSHCEPVIIQLRRSWKYHFVTIPLHLKSHSPIMPGVLMLDKWILMVTNISPSPITKISTRFIVYWLSTCWIVERISQWWCKRTMILWIISTKRKLIYIYIGIKRGRHLLLYLDHFGHYMWTPIISLRQLSKFVMDPSNNVSIDHWLYFI